MGQILIGGHVSSSGGALKAFENAKAIGANFVQIFTQSPRMWRSSVVSDEDAAQFKALLNDPKEPVVGLVTHASYLINLASEESELLEKSRIALADNLKSATKLGASGLVLHVGSHKGAGLGKVLPSVVAALSSVFDSLENPCRILLENTAGQGGSVGVTFEELAQIIEAMDYDQRIGICLDTQHLFASGVSFDSLVESDLVINQLSGTVGLERLGCIHLNDSKVPKGSQKDRHENLGEGFIGPEPISLLISHPAISEIPLVLEVPGAGNGPRKEDVEKARQLLDTGRMKRSG